MKAWDLLRWLQPSESLCMICTSRRVQALSSTLLDRVTLKKLSQYLCAPCFNEIAWIDQVLCMHCGRHHRCPDCQLRQASSLWLNRSAVAYQSMMKEWLYRYKFQGDERLADLLGTMLMPAIERVSAQLIIKHRLEQAWRASRKPPLRWLKASRTVFWDAVTAVPISEERYRERGFNQAYQLAQIVSRAVGVPYVELLVRTSHEQRQSHQGRGARFQGIDSRYQSSAKGWNMLMRHVGKRDKLHILLIDDVYTTGSTVHACAQALKQSSPCELHVASITWARS